MSNDRLLEMVVDPETGGQNIRWFTSSELINLGVNAPEYIAQLQEQERSNGDSQV